MEEVSMFTEYEILFGFRPPHPLPVKRKAVRRGDDAVRPTDEQVIAYVVDSGTVTSESLSVGMKVDRKDAIKILKRLADRGDIARSQPGWAVTIYSPQPEGADRPMTVRRQVLEAIEEAGEADADKVAEMTDLAPSQVKDAAIRLKAEGSIYVHKRYKRGSSWIPVWRVKPS